MGVGYIIHTSTYPCVYICMYVHVTLLSMLSKHRNLYSQNVRSQCKGTYIHTDITTVCAAICSHSGFVIITVVP